MKVYQQPFGSLTEYVLYNPASGNTVTILPEFGGIIRSLLLHKNLTGYEVIQAAATETALRTDDSYPSTHLFPWPSRIPDGKYSFEGKDYQLPINEPPRQTAIHGLIHHEVYEVVDQQADEKGAQVTLQHIFTGKEAGYPFPFQFSVTYRLGVDGRVTLAYAVQNTGTAPMPMGLGWHPYFHLDEPVDSMSIGFPAEATFILDNQMIPVAKDFFLEATAGFSLKNRQLDSPYCLYRDRTIATTKLVSEAKEVTLNVWQEVGEGKFDYLVVYTPLTRERIAIEPMTCNVNAFNSGDGLITLQPGQTWQAECGVYLS